MKKRQDFSIPRNATQLVVNTTSVVIVSDLTFGLYLFFVVWIRDTLSVDTTFSLLAWGGFLIKLALTAWAVFNMLRSWLSTNYYVMNDQLIIYNRFASSETSSRKLSSLSKIKINQSRMGRAKNFGDLELTFVDGSSSEKVTLFDIAEVDNVAGQLSSLGPMK